jgi:gas vesicle protein
MRMSGFVLGGILGAAAAMYFSKNNKPMMFTNWNQAGQAVNKMMDTAKDKIMGVTGMNNNNNTAFNENPNLDRVEQIVHEDPQLKQEVDEILRENNKTNAFQTQ